MSILLFMLTLDKLYGIDDVVHEIDTINLSFSLYQCILRELYASQRYRQLDPPGMGMKIIQFIDPYTGTTYKVLPRAKAQV